MDEEKVEQQDQEKAPAAPPAPKPATAPAAATAAPAAKPAAPPAAAAKPAAPPKVEPPSLPPLEMLSPPLKAFLEATVRSGGTVTIQIDKDTFTGRVFRLMLHEGWLAIEHQDGRRRAFQLITGGKITAPSGESFDLPGGHGK